MYVHLVLSVICYLQNKNMLNHTIMRGVIILTSTGLSAQQVRQAAKKFFGKLLYKSVAIVTTAAEGKENNKYSRLAESQFKELGFDFIDFVDLENNPETDFSF